MAVTLPVPVTCGAPPAGSALTWTETDVGANPRQRLRRRFRVAYEMGDMVEENLAGKGELAVRLSSLVLHQQGLSWRTPRNRRGAC